eukprot:CAMPEP_0201740860 /NCGR_PEP_ID=MMETSP0593-20130828/46516_1 /ASSEMBLY_ACC=CAM_ASM_000672 /TAXON_ID=267983 /ORGANISM="Skeletonema japonicum, Strain CCMP2506" /LENGTH=195 /DNA_ID=CAMNT_0048235181 /DNA_START=2038 /DNA_END=2625 /DNA_ORIENTATION=+
MKSPAGSDDKSDATDPAHLPKLAEKKVKKAEEKAKKDKEATGNALKPAVSTTRRSDANSELWALLNYSKMRIEIETGCTPRLGMDGSVSMANSAEEDEESHSSRSDDEDDSSDEEDDGDEEEDYELPSFLKDDVDPEEARTLYEEAKFKAASVLSVSEEKLTDAQMLQASLKRLPGLVKRKQQQHKQTRRQKRNQ